MLSSYPAFYFNLTIATKQLIILNNITIFKVSYHVTLYQEILMTTKFLHNAFMLFNFFQITKIS